MRLLSGSYPVDVGQNSVGSIYLESEHGALRGARQMGKDIAMIDYRLGNRVQGQQSNIQSVAFLKDIVSSD